MSAGDREVAELWRRALESLAASENLLRDGFPDFAASRAYYAAFYAASALFLSAGQTFSKHTAVRAHLHKAYVREGMLSPEAGASYNFLFRIRALGDYGRAAHVSSSGAQEAIEKARKFLDAIQPLLPPEILTEK